MLRCLRWSLLGALVLICAFSVVSWIETGLPDSVLWFFYLLGNFRLQFLVCQLIAFLYWAVQFCLAQTQRKPIGLSLVLLLPFLLINLSYLLPYYVTKPMTHPSVPLSPEALSRQKEQFLVLAKERPSFQKDLIVFGDFNSTTWQPHVQVLLRQAGLKDSMLGFGVQPSWMTQEPWVTVPIDHILVSQRFSVFNRFIGPEVGSDHRPVIVSLN